MDDACVVGVALILLLAFGRVNSCLAELSHFSLFLLVILFFLSFDTFGCSICTGSFESFRKTYQCRGPHDSKLQTFFLLLPNSSPRHIP